MGMPENSFSYFIGGLALLSTTFSMLFFCRLYLPETRLKILDELLVETKEIHRKTNEEGLLSDLIFDEVQARLRRLVHMPLCCICPQNTFNSLR
jgi:hypothetical protein